MAEPAPTIRRPATYQDVLDAPPHKVAELIRGALHLHPRPQPRHAYASSRLGGKLDPFNGRNGGPGGWIILDEPELHLGTDILVPDLGGWRRERLPRLPQAAWFELAPDWVCEVLSPGTRTYDLTEKREIYGAHDVSWLWLVDPDARTLEAFAHDGMEWRLIKALHDAETVSLPPFEALSWSLDVLWEDG